MTMADTWAGSRERRARVGHDGAKAVADSRPRPFVRRGVVVQQRVLSAGPGQGVQVEGNLLHVGSRSYLAQVDRIPEAGRSRTAAASLDGSSDDVADPSGSRIELGGSGYEEATSTEVISARSA
jgi:hypothetical protein